MEFEGSREGSERSQIAKYEEPKVVDHGTLLDLTRVGGTVAQKDVPHGLPNSAFPS
jgi:hypothetical protein